LVLVHVDLRVWVEGVNADIVIKPKTPPTRLIGSLAALLRGPV